MKPFDLAIAGELNLDLILYGLPLQMETERELLGTSFVSTLGSSSAIVAHNAASLGLRVRFATLIGDDDFGRLALQRLQRAGVDTSGAMIDPAVQTGVTIVLPHPSPDGAVRHCLSYPGSIAALTVEHLQWAQLAEARHFHLSSLYLQTGLHRGLVELLGFLKGAGLTISLDTNDDPANTWGSPLHEVLPFVDIFLPNESEICRMAGVDDLDRAVKAFASEVPTIIVKRGRYGCRLIQQGDVTDYRGVTVTPVDTIGAGDSFDAGFLRAYLQGESMGACARAGNISGALSTLSNGGTEAFGNASLREAFLREHGYPGIGV